MTQQYFLTMGQFTLDTNFGTCSEETFYFKSEVSVQFMYKTQFRFLYSKKYYSLVFNQIRS